MATHGKIATSWQSVAGNLSTMNEFEGGVKPDQLKRHYAELMSAFRKETKTSGYTSGKRTGASECVQRTLNDLMTDENETAESKKRDVAAKEGRETKQAERAAQVMQFPIRKCYHTKPECIVRQRARGEDEI